MKHDLKIERHYRERMEKRSIRQKRRHRRRVLIGLAASVALLLSGRLLIGKLMTSSSARITTETSPGVEVVQASEASTASSEEISVEYRTKTDMEARNDAPRTEKQQHDGYTNQLDTFLMVNHDTVLYARESTKSSEVAPLEAGTYVETYGTANEWTRVMSKGRTVYVRNRDLDVVSDPSWFKTVDGQVIVNAKFGLPDTYETVFHADAEAGLKVMREAMERDGLSVEVATTYRSAQDEKKELILRGNPAHAPEPGHAVFQTGYGVQFYAPNTDPRIDNDFEKTPQFAWLKEHAPEYGFILRYPEGSESITGYRADPTIFTYVGVEDASIISSEGLTMEVFYGVN